MMFVITSDDERLQAYQPEPAVMSYSGAGVGVMPELLAAILQAAASLHYAFRNGHLRLTVHVPSSARPEIREQVQRRLDDGIGPLPDDEQVTAYFTARDLDLRYDLATIVRLPAAQPVG